MAQVKRGRGGAVKKAPDGFYTAKQAREKLGLPQATFSLYVRQGKIKRTVPHLRVEGFYKKEEIDMLAREMELFLTIKDPAESVETRVARAEDTPGIVQVLSIRGWKTASDFQRASWYQKNPFIDYVVIHQHEVMGYINATPYTKAALEDIMAGKRRAWHMTAADILTYEPDTSYDIYVGIATRTDIPNHTQRFGFRLIAGFMHFLQDLASHEIYIRRMYAVSAEPDGQKLCRDLGFMEQEAQEGDLFPRFMLDLERSSARFAQLYRVGVRKQKQRKSRLEKQKGREGSPPILS